MVIGNGLLSKTFKEFENNTEILFFCSGVSNSKCIEISEFEREETLLTNVIETNQSLIFIYFSTCSIEDPSMVESMYVQHKLKMEGIISERCHRYYIFRLSNAVGKSENPNTVLNFFFNSINQEKEFDLWQNSNRNLIDVDDVLKIVRKILMLGLFQNSIVNIANEISFSAIYIVATIEDFLNKRGSYILRNKGYPIEISIDKIKSIIKSLNIKFDDGYLIRLLEKYYIK